MANDELMRLAERVDALIGDYAFEVPGADAIAADLRALAQRAPQNGAVSEGWVLLPRDPVTALPILRALSDAAGLRRLPDPNEDGAYPITGQQSTVRQWYDKLLAAAPAPEARRPGPDMSKSWPERDYMCKCSQCGSQFIGAKRQAVCKACAPESPEAERAKGEVNLCSDCPPNGYPTDGTRCVPCPRRPNPAPPPAGQPEGVDDYERIYAEVIKVCADQPMAHEIASRLASAQRAGKDGA